ncbi:MAG: hypothetical protein NTW74_17795 [Acidobacteria bacterium]|nr:hypothetical protein [Acidobacteriota bacterium]
MRFLLLLVCSGLAAQVLLIDGESAFVVPPRTNVELKVVLSAASLGGNVSGINVRFVPPAGQPSVTVRTDASGKASTMYMSPDSPGYFNVDAVAELGDGAVVSFAFSVGALAPTGSASALKAEVRRVLLRNAADGSNLQLVGPYWLPAGSLVRPARWGKDKEAGGLWRAEVGSWLLWVDDGPSKSWAKPTRFYLVPGNDLSQARISGEMWWPLLRPPDGNWQSVGRTTSAAGALIPVADLAPVASETCGVLLSTNFASSAGFEAYLRRTGVSRLFMDSSLALGCKRTYVLVSGMGDADGVWLDRWFSWEELGQRFKNLGELTVVVETNQSGLAAKFWNGLGLSGVVVSSTDDFRVGFMQPLRGGYVVRGLLPALERSSGNFELAVAETQRGELTVGSARPQIQRLVASGIQRLALEDVEFSNVGGVRWLRLDSRFGAASASVSDSKVATAIVSGNGLLKAGRTRLKVRSHDGKVVGDIPVQVAEPGATLAGSIPTSCPDAATYRATFNVSGGDQTLFERFGGAWWGNGITLVFRRLGAEQFEIRSSGAPEGQFFAMGGRLAVDCSFVGSGTGVAGLRVTTAQVRGRIVQRAGVFDTMTLDYSIGVDGVFPQPIEYRGTGSLAAGCAYQLSLGENLTAWGGLFPVRVASPALCPWISELTAGTAEVVAGQVGFGPGVVWLQVPENSGAARNISLRVGGVAIEMTQPGRLLDSPVVLTSLNAGSLETVVTPGSQAIILGSGLQRPLLMGGLAATTLYFNPGYMVVQVPDRVGFGVVEVERTPVLVERSSPGIVSVADGNVFVTGLDPDLPVWVEVGGLELGVVAIRPVGAGVFQLEFTVFPARRGAIVVRQGGRSSQRGVFVM